MILQDWTVLMMRQKVRHQQLQINPRAFLSNIQAEEELEQADGG